MKGIDVEKLNSDLLVVVLAILTDAVPRSAVAQAMKSWTENSGQSLVDWLKRSAELDDERIGALECLASAHFKAHQNDIDALIGRQRACGRNKFLKDLMIGREFQAEWQPGFA